MRTRQIALHIVKNPPRHPREHLAAGRLFRLEIIQGDLGLIVEHFLEMRHEPLLVDRVPVEAAAQMVVQPALGHFLQGVPRHLHGVGPKFG